MALGSTQPLTEMSTMNISLGKGGRCVRLTTYHNPVPLSRNLGTLTSWNPLGLSRPVTGMLYLYLYLQTLIICTLHLVKTQRSHLLFLTTDSTKCHRDIMRSASTSSSVLYLIWKIKHVLYPTCIIISCKANYKVILRSKCS